MKKLFFSCFYIFLSFGVTAQMSVGSEALFVGADTQVSLDGLTLKPLSDLTITNNALSVSTTPASGTPPGITRVYVFNSAITFTGTAGLFYQTSELNGNNEGNLTLAHGNGTTMVTTTGSTVDATNNYISNQLVSPVSLKTVTAITMGALPVSLVYFSVKKQENSALLSWATSSEKNSSLFEIQRSTDAKNWLVLGITPSIKNSMSTQAYEFTDHNIERGTNFYRLKMLDQDGSFTYSSMKTLQFENDLSVISYPNPATEKLIINTEKSEAILSVKLVNSQGRIVYESGQTNHALEIDVRNYTSGIYIIQILQSDNKTRSIKFVKQ